VENKKEPYGVVNRKENSSAPQGIADEDDRMDGVPMKLRIV
jgi:hypothetical protein